MFASFAERSREAELMDGADYTAAEMIENLADLRRVNRYLGGQRALTRHLFPMIQTVWATGPRRVRLLDVGAGSADIPARIVSWARGRGIESGSAADQQLTDWLDRRPEDSVFRRAGSLISALVESGGRFDISPDDIIKYGEAIAEASGGLFGIRRISAEERATLSRIAAEIKGRQK